MEEYSNVAIIGRFQPFHWGHFEYLLHASTISSNVVIGVTNPDHDAFYFHDSDLTRSHIDSNPFSFEERVEMIQSTVQFYKLPIVLQFRKCYLDDDEALQKEFGDVEAIVFTTYDKWNQHKKEIFENLRFKTINLWNRQEKIVSGSEIRRRMSLGLEWAHLVPIGTKMVLEEK